MRKRMRFEWMLCGCLLAATSGFVARATDIAWSVDANGNWVDNGNWNPATAPGAGDTATFGPTLTADCTVTVDSNRAIGGIAFGNTNQFAYTLSGGNLLLANGGVIQVLAGNGTHTDLISSPISLQGDGGSAVFSANAAVTDSVLCFEGNVSGAASVSKTTTVTLAGSLYNIATNKMKGVLSDGGGGGALEVVKSGLTNMWVL